MPITTEIPPSTTAPQAFPSLPHPSPELDAKLFAHVFCDGFLQEFKIDGKEMEGQFFHTTIGYLASIFSQNKEGFRALGLDTNSLIERLQFATEISQKEYDFVDQFLEGSSSTPKELQISAFASTLSKEILEKVQNLQTGDTLLLPGGWVGSRSGHALLYEILKTKNGFSFRVFNTGSGIEDFHPQAPQGNKNKHCVCLELTEVDQDVILDARFYQTMLELDLIPYFNKKVDFKAHSIYKGLLAPLKGTLSNSAQTNPLNWSTGQRSGTCAWKVLMAMIKRNCQSKEQYREVKRLIRNQTLGDCQQFLISNKAENYLRKRGFQKWMLSILKDLERDPTLLGEVQQIRMQVEQLVTKQCTIPSIEPLISSKASANYPLVDLSSIGFIEIENSQSQQKLGSLNLQQEPPLFTKIEDVAETLKNWDKYSESMAIQSQKGVQYSLAFLSKAIKSLPIPQWNAKDEWSRLSKEQLPVAQENALLLLEHFLSCVDSIKEPHSLTTKVSTQHLLAIIEKITSLLDPLSHRVRARFLTSSVRSFASIDVRSFASIDEGLLSTDYLKELCSYFDLANQNESNTIFSFKNTQWNSFPPPSKQSSSDAPSPIDESYVFAAIQRMDESEKAGQPYESLYLKVQADIEGLYIPRSQAVLKRAVVGIHALFLTEKTAPNLSADSIEQTGEDPSRSSPYERLTLCSSENKVKQIQDVNNPDSLIRFFKQRNRWQGQRNALREVDLKGEKHGLTTLSIPEVQKLFGNDCILNDPTEPIEPNQQLATFWNNFLGRAGKQIEGRLSWVEDPDRLFRSLAFFQTRPELLTDFYYIQNILIATFFQKDNYRQTLAISKERLPERIKQFFTTVFDTYFTSDNVDMCMFLIDFISRISLLHATIGDDNPYQTLSLEEKIKDVESIAYTQREKDLCSLVTITAKYLPLFLSEKRFAPKEKEAFISDLLKSKIAVFIHKKTTEAAQLTPDKYFLERVAGDLNQIEAHFFDQECIEFLDGQENRIFRQNLLSSIGSVLGESTGCWTGNYPFYSNGSQEINFLSNTVDWIADNKTLNPTIVSICQENGVDHTALKKDGDFLYSQDRVWRFQETHAELIVERSISNNWYKLTSGVVEDINNRIYSEPANFKFLLKKLEQSLTSISKQDRVFYRYFKDSSFQELLSIVIMSGDQLTYGLDSSLGRNYNGKFGEPSVQKIYREANGERYVFVPLDKNSPWKNCFPFSRSYEFNTNAKVWQSETSNSWIIEDNIYGLTFQIRDADVSCWELPGAKILSEELPFTHFKSGFYFLNDKGQKTLATIPGFHQQALMIEPSEKLNHLYFFTLDEHNLPIIRHSLDALALSSIKLIDRDYEAAYHLLFQGTSADIFDKKTLSLLSSIVDVEDNDIDALCVKLHAAAQLSKHSVNKGEKTKDLRANLIYSHYAQQKQSLSLPPLTPLETRLLSINASSRGGNETTPFVLMDSLKSAISSHFEDRAFTPKNMDEIPFLGSGKDFQSHFVLFYNAALESEKHPQLKQRLLTMRGESCAINRGIANFLEKVMCNPSEFKAITKEHRYNFAETQFPSLESIDALEGLPVSCVKERSSVTPGMPAVSRENRPVEIMPLQPYENSSENLEALEKQILDLAQKISNSSPEFVEKVRLKRFSGQEKVITLKEAAALFVLGDKNSYRKRTHLTNAEIEELDQLIGSYLFLKGDIEYKKTLPVSAQPQERAFQFKEHSDKLTRAFIAFEALSGMRLRPDQISYIEDITKKGSYRILHAIMGAGKSKVLAPLWALLLAQDNKLPFLVLPDALFETGKEFSLKTACELFGQFGHCLSFSRDSDFSQEKLDILYESLQQWHADREFVFTTKESLLCLLLKVEELLDNYQSTTSTSEKKDLAPLVQNSLKIVDYLHTHAVGLFDEWQLLMHCRNLVNFTFGHPQQIDQAHVDAVFDIVRLLIEDSEIAALLDLQSNNQAKMSEESYHRIIKPKVLGYALQRFNVTNREEFIGYVEDTIDKTPEFIKNHPQRDAVAITKALLHSYLPSTLSRNCDEHYGFRPNISFAIPYLGSNTPSLKAQFALWIETTLYTGYTYIQKGIKPDEMQAWIHKLRELSNADAALYDLSRKETSAAKLFKKLFDKDLFDRHNPTELCEEIKGKCEGILAYVSQMVIPDILFYPKRLEGSGHSLFSIFNWVDGMTGTPGNYTTYPSVCELDINPEIEEKSTNILRNRVSSFHSIAASQSKEILKNAVDIVSKKIDYRAVIDVGALFKGLSNQEVATGLLAGFASCQGIRFFGEDDSLYILDRSGKVVLASESELSANDLAIYYDQRHSVGTDEKNSPRAIGLLLVSESTQRDSLFQGMWRLRQLEKEQTIECVIPKNVARLISKDEIVTSDKLLTFVTESQEKKMLLDNLYARKQEIINLIKKHALHTMLDNTSFDRQMEIYQQAREAFVKFTDWTPFEMFGKVNKEVSGQESLRLYAQHWIAFVQSWKNDLFPNKQNLIDEIRSIKIVALPLTDKTSVEEDDLSVETQAEKQVEEEVEEQTQTFTGNPTTKCPTHTVWNWPYYLDINQPSHWLVPQKWQSPRAAPSIKTKVLTRAVGISGRIYETALRKIKVQQCIIEDSKTIIPLKIDRSIDSLYQMLRLASPPPLFRASDLFDKQGYLDKTFNNLFGDRFYLTNNFLRITPKWCWEEGIEPFSLYSKPVFHMLVVVQGERVSSILIDQNDHRFFRQKLSENSESKDSLIFIYDPISNSVTQDGKKQVDPDWLKSNKEFIRHCMFAKFWSGAVNKYTKDEVAELKNWITEQGPAQMKLLFQRIIEHKPNSQKMFANSLVDRTFKECAAQANEVKVPNVQKQVQQPVSIAQNIGMGSLKSDARHVLRA